jgi:heat shock protein HslJ
MMTTIRQPWLLVAVLAVLGILAAGFVAYDTIYRSFPANHVMLAGTRWAVAAIQGAPGGSALGSVAFRQDGTALITTGCEAFSVSWGLDTSDDSIGFYDVPPAPASCSGDVSDQDLTLRRALEGVRTWLVDSPERIELHGADRVTLTLLPSSS